MRRHFYKRTGLFPTHNAVCVCSLFFFIFVFSGGFLHAFTQPLQQDMPETIQVKGKKIQLKSLQNPLRGDTANLKKYVREGSEVYFKNCFLCHGDLLDGDGVFGKSFFPEPASFKTQPTLAEKPESYAYWRIMKGGKGLPSKFKPWDSAMPAWENSLSEEQVWKTLLFIYENLGEKDKNIHSVRSVERGQEVYLEKCAQCHGETGKGDGPAANFTSPPPRNLTKSQYKFRSTPFGKLPTDEDIFSTLTRGMPGTSMPAWKHLSELDRWSLVDYLKTIAPKFAKFKEKEGQHEIITIPEPPPSTPERLEAGKRLFVMNCSGCHGLEGRSDGESTKRIVNMASGAIWPRNLSKPWTFRRGNAPKDLFLTIRSGLYGTAMPRFDPKNTSDDEVWNITHYVRTLALFEKPDIRHAIQSAKVSGSLPLDPEDSAWKSVTSYYFPLGGQIIESEKSYFPTVNGIAVKTMHNGEEIAFQLSWDDPTFDPILAELTPVTESPPPPLPPATPTQETKAVEIEDEKNEKPESQEFPDSVALQFPVKTGPDGEKPYFLNGDSKQPVNLWKWNSFPMKAVEMNAEGIDKFTPQLDNSQGTEAKTVYRYGQYRLVLKRKLTTTDPDHDIQFKPGQTVPIAINVWDGSALETGTRKAISSWFEVALE